MVELPSVQTCESVGAWDISRAEQARLRHQQSQPAQERRGSAGGGDVHVRGYYRANGTYVRGYTRRRHR